MGGVNFAYGHRLGADVPFLSFFAEILLVSLIEALVDLLLLFHLRIHCDFEPPTIIARLHLALGLAQPSGDLLPALVYNVEFVLNRVRIHDVSEDGELFVLC